LDVSVFTANRSGHGDDYEAAIKAADAVFGRSAVEAPETIASSGAPTGRVLPSLIESTVFPSAPSTEAAKDAPRGSVAKKAKTTTPVRVKSRARPTTPAVRQERAAAQEPVKPRASEPRPNISTASELGRDHESRSVRKRRLLDAELKAGERWKRRLCKAAR
jgi:hypothetical protein